MKNSRQLDRVEEVEDGIWENHICSVAQPRVTGMKVWGKEQGVAVLGAWAEIQVLAAILCSVMLRGYMAPFNYWTLFSLIYNGFAF